MIAAKVFGPFGKVRATVVLPLSKSTAATRVLDRLQDGKISPAGAQARLVGLDSGGLHVEAVLDLFTPDEVRQAIERRLDSLSIEEEELRALREILAAHDAARAGGGDKAARR